MGRFLSDAIYGPDVYAHEGYAGRILDDGTVSGEWSTEVNQRATGRLAAVCSCGWRSERDWDTDTRPDDFPGEELTDRILTVWETDHAVPAMRCAFGCELEPDPIRPHETARRDLYAALGLAENLARHWASTTTVEAAIARGATEDDDQVVNDPDVATARDVAERLGAMRAAVSLAGSYILTDDQDDQPAYRPDVIL